MNALKTAWVGLALVLLAGSGCATLSPASRAPTFTLWQLPNQTHSQIMSYVIRTAHGRIIVIDGGTTGDGPYLKGFLAALGGEVDTWIISHAHDDHFGALTAILAAADAPAIGRMYASLPDMDWIRKYGYKPDVKPYEEFLAAVHKAGLKVVEARVGDTFEIDGVRTEVFGVRNPELTKNAINNSSMVWRMSDKRKSVLFLADLGEEGGRKLLASPYANRLRADYVQMAHHGQNGVDEDVYRAIQPRCCLWPTPLWLWDNDKGQGKGSGPWQTLTVRAWMEKLPIERHYVMTEGLCRIE